VYGLVYLRSHDIVRQDVLDFYQDFVEVLARDASEKATWGGDDIWFQRGWTPPNTEQAIVAGGQPDFKECYFAAAMPVDHRCAAFWPQVYAPNVWPAGAHRFRERYLALSRSIHGVGLDLLRGCAWALGVDERAFVGMCEGAAHVSRALRYLPLSSKQTGTGVLWGEEHTDFNLMTLLPGGCFFRPDGQLEAGRPDGVGGGLTLRTRPSADHPDGQVVAGRPPDGCIVAQVGQQLEVLSGGRFLATPHRISAPDEPGWTRCSFAHFVHLHGMTPIAPLPGFQDADPAYAPPVLAGTYATKTLVDIGLAPRSAIDQLGYRQYERLAAIRKREG
jgi:isopenicillin N synthase-like dioxygenase